MISTRWLEKRKPYWDRLEHLLDAATRKEVKQLNLGGGAAGILIAPDGSRAYVAVSTADKIDVVDLKSLEVTGQIDAGKQPDGLAWAAQK